MTNKLFIGSLDYSTTEAELASHFAAAGQVLSAKIITDRETGRSKGFGFVEMSTPEEAQAAIQQLNNSNLGARSIIVNEAKPQEKRESRGFDNRGGGGGYNNKRGNDRDYRSKRKSW